TERSASDYVASRFAALYALGLIVMIIAIAIGWVAVRSITRPLRSAVDAADRIAAGDVTVDLVATSNDEAGTLLASMATMADSLERMTSLAERIADGDLTAMVSPRSEKDVLGVALQKMTARLSQII